MKGSILQPTYLPWLGYFDMIDVADIYVVFDHVQFVKKSWQQRNRIKTHNGELMLTVPVKKATLNTPIKDIEIHDRKVLSNHWKTITLAYKNSLYFKEYRGQFERIYNNKYVFLRDLNIDIIKMICEILDIKKEIIFSSNFMPVNENKKSCKTERVLNLCKKIGIDILYDANGASQFLDSKMFYKERIDLQFQNLKYPTYKQMHGKFIPYLSVIDLIFNEGHNSLNIIRQARNYQRYDDLVNKVNKNN
mgnify:CR=1 FL=1|jgi:hypothetical protein|tara:strand:- start:2240 stop:2983 length:744 start_codon:yes stop_codon:yes gene_type:complete